MDQLTSAEKEELRAAGKEVPPIPVIPDSDDEDEDDDEEDTNPVVEQELECIDLTEGGDIVPTNPPIIPEPADEEQKKKLAVKIKQERIEQNRAADEGAGQAA